MTVSSPYDWATEEEGEDYEFWQVETDMSGLEKAIWWLYGMCLFALLLVVVMAGLVLSVA